MANIDRLFIALYTDADITRELAPALRDRGAAQPRQAYSMSMILFS
jgi:hypothetical protein